MFYPYMLTIPTRQRILSILVLRIQIVKRKHEDNTLKEYNSQSLAWLVIITTADKGTSNYTNLHK